MPQDKLSTGLILPDKISNGWNDAELSAVDGVLPDKMLMDEMSYHPNANMFCEFLE